MLQAKNGGIPKHALYILWFCIGLAYVFGLFVDIMDVDSGQYASMSMEMLETGQYLQITDSYRAYLDKPPLLLWLSSLSISIFGLHTFAFKLPSLLVSLLGIYATYRLGKLWYGSGPGIWAATLLASCQAWFLFNMDVRTDAMLAGFTVFAVWQLSEFQVRQRWINLIGGFAGIGLAMLSKGPMGMVLPAIGIGMHLLLNRNWKMIFNWKWIIGLLITALVLLPMCIGLYRQHGMYGLEFFFWLQSFGRITGENVWDNHAPIYFLAQNILWAFLPWTLLLLVCLWLEIRRYARDIWRGHTGAEYIFLPAFLIPLVALSLSHYQLPHYVFIIFPYAALMCGSYFGKISFSGERPQLVKILLRVQFGIIWLLFAGAILLATYIFPFENILILLLGILVFIVAFISCFIFKNQLNRLLISVAFAAAATNIILSGVAYPKLLSYQPSRAIGQKIKESGADRMHFYYFGNLGSHSMNFYRGSVIKPIFISKADSMIQALGPIYIYTDRKGREEMCQEVPCQALDSFQTFKVQKLNIKFVLPESRKDASSTEYLLLISKNF